ELRGDFEDETRALRRELPEPRIRHLGDLAFSARPDPGAALRLLVEEPHLAEELALVEVREDHLVAVLVLDHHFDGPVDDVVQHVRQIAGMDHYRLRRHRSDPAVAEEAIYRGYIAQRSKCFFHFQRLRVYLI